MTKKVAGFKEDRRKPKKDFCHLFGRKRESLSAKENKVQKGKRLVNPEFKRAPSQPIRSFDRVTWQPIGQWEAVWPLECEGGGYSTKVCSRQLLLPFSSKGRKAAAGAPTPSLESPARRATRLIRHCFLIRITTVEAKLRLLIALSLSVFFGGLWKHQFSHSCAVKRILNF